MWNDVFLHDFKDEKIAIVLMDTQGLFDTNTPAEINARIFSMSVLISSVQIFNIHKQIAENHLEYLKVQVFIYLLGTVNRCKFTQNLKFKSLQESLQILQTAVGLIQYGTP